MIFSTSIVVLTSIELTDNEVLIITLLSACKVDLNDASPPTDKISLINILLFALIVLSKVAIPFTDNWLFT